VIASRTRKPTDRSCSRPISSSAVFCPGSTSAKTPTLLPAFFGLVAIFTFIPSNPFGVNGTTKPIIGTLVLLLSPLSTAKMLI
jgi:hypothetical protein